MAHSDKVGNFKITAGLDFKIQAEQVPKEGDIEDCKINDNRLLWRTVEILIDMLRDSRLRSRKEFEFLGENLYSILLENKIGEALYKAIYDNSPQMDYWRVEFEFKSERTVQHPLASWPWEYLYCPAIAGWGGGDFLAERANLVLSRRLTIHYTPRNLLVPEDETIKVLFVAPSPKSLSPVEYGPVLETLKSLQATPQNRIKLTTLVDPYPSEEGNDTNNSQPDNKYDPQATFSKFVQMVIQLNPHVIHFVGHGRSIINEGGQLAFMHERVLGEKRWVGEKELASKLGGTALRLVFLQACESALPASSYSPYETASGIGYLHNPYEAISGIAMQIANRNIPAVVAMQYRIKSLVANKFSEAFYKALVGYKSIDAAMQAGRLEILTDISEWAKTSSFGLPVLYLREPGSLIAPQKGTEQTGIGSTAAGVFTRNADIGQMPPIQPRTSVLIDDQEEILCPWCNQPCDATDHFCICGQPLICTNCETRVKRQRTNCGGCGQLLQVKGKP